MPELRVGYDVVIAGAGPAGIAAAAAFAERGAEVLLLEAEPGAAAKRLAGEWMHPTGAEALGRLSLFPDEVLLDHPMGRGFVILPEDGSATIELPYGPGELGFSCEHSALVGAMRERIRGRARVHYVEGARLVDFGDGRVQVRIGESARELEAGLLVGADGKGSIVRKRICEPDTGPSLSQMAGVLLEDVELPNEGMGHVFVGGPGPALAYRLDARSVRLIVDVPAAHGRRGPGDLYAAFAPALPGSLRAAFREALESRPILWAGIGLRPRTAYGRDKVALIGDSVGVVHPLCAAGITLAVFDAEALAAAESVEAYAKRREAASHIPELLTQALYEVFVRIDPSASAIREAMYRAFRENPRERSRTINILSGREVGRDAFSSAFVNVALSAAREIAEDAAEDSPLRAAAAVRRLKEWSRYPARALSPKPLRLRQRSEAARMRLAVRPLSPATETAVELDPALLVRSDAAASTPTSSLLRRAGALTRAAEVGGAPVVGAAARELVDELARCERPSLEELAAVAQALGGAADTRPGLGGVGGGDAMSAIRETVLAYQEGDGGFGGVARTAHAILALRAAGARSVSTTVRRPVDALLDLQRDDGGFAEASDDATSLTALALRALVRAECSDTAAVHRAARKLVRELPAERGSHADEARAALALYEARVAEAPSEPPKRLRKTEDGSLVGQDWDDCLEALDQVSRSFARPIAALPEPLRVAVTCGYLLCRIADTVEDAPHTAPERRDVHYGRLLDVLEGRKPPSHFARGLEGLPGKPVELALCSRLGKVLRVLETTPAPMSDAVKRWAAEMVRGMAIYSHRPLGEDALRAPAGIADLERYCYFVAGTVGHMLTELFLLHVDCMAPSAVRALREEAESFGIGLQLVNILKDITDDQARGVSYVPRSLADGQGLALPDLLDEKRRATAHSVVDPLFDVARKHLDRALEYTIAIPVSEPRIRLFCLLPLWMAARTLVHARGNDAIFVPDRPVKIDRAEVESLAADCLARAGNDEALRAGYSALWTEPKKARSAHQPAL